MLKTETFNNKSALIARLTELAESGNWVFRGYSKQDQLHPNIIRRKLVDQERELLFEFERSANQYLNTSNPVDFMSYAQHMVWQLDYSILHITHSLHCFLHYSPQKVIIIRSKKMPYITIFATAT